MRILFALLLTAAPLFARPADWEKRSDEDGIQVFAREVPGSRVREMKAVGLVDAPPVACYRVVSDLDNYVHTMPYTKESRVVGKDGDHAVYFYSLISTPVVSDRDYTIHIIDESKPRPDGGGYRTSWTIADDKGPAPRDGVVRVTVNTGFWEFEPAEGGKKTKATYYVLTDPGGSIPAWIANRANTTAVPNVFKAIRAAVKDRKYSAAK